MNNESLQAGVLPIYFDYDSYAVRNDQVVRIEANARFLREHPALSIVVQGHADERGSTDYNLALGDSRANAVKSALIHEGIAESRLSVISYGKERPFCSESNDLCWKENRRAHFDIR